MLYPVYVLLRRDLMAVNVGGVVSGSGIHFGRIDLTPLTIS
jgi:hypothetical protein